MKERIIGAIVLVAVVVLVVPVFLDGPPDDDDVITERVRLPGQSEQASQTVVLDRDREEPVPAAPRPEPASPRPAPAAAQDRPDTEQADAEDDGDAAAREEPARTLLAAAETPPATTPTPAAPAPQSSTGMWAVQLGSFSNQQNAEKLAADLRKQGFAAFLSKLDTDGGQLHRVRIGPQKDRDTAEAMAARLQNAGHKGQVVPHP